MYLKRKAYDELVAWKERPGHSTLEVSGARQVGKTYIVNRFADEQYSNKIYINLLEISGEYFLERYQELWQDMKEGQAYENPVYELIKRYQPDFIDSEDTIVIIDEIQESADIYNRIREFTRALKSDFIVTGSYLGRVLNSNFKMSAGDLSSLRIETLDFEEFVDAFGKRDIYDALQIYGMEMGQGYEEIDELFRLYTEIGGYPSVVMEYLETASKDRCREKLEDVIHLFCTESIRYFEDILDAAVYDNIFCNVARILYREKKGLDEDNFNESLQKLVIHEYDSNIGKAVCNRAIMWLQSAGILDFAGKVSECKIMDFKGRCRCFFTDLGLTYYFLRKIGADVAGIKGTLYENFAFLELRRRVERLREIALETPAYATYKGGEIDFYVKSLEGNEKVYAVEVKSGKQAAPTGQLALEDGRIDYLLLLKGKTKGGKTDKILTIPIFLFSKFRFIL